MVEPSSPKGGKLSASGNNFKPEDMCICEFKQEKGKQFILEMGILRAGSWLPKKESKRLGPPEEKHYEASPRD